MSGEGDNTSIYTYNGVDEVPEDVTHVRVDPSVTVIPDNAFQSRHELVVVELPEGLTRIGDRAFSDCMSLKRINLPSTLKEIGERAFHSCEKLENITLPAGLRQFGRYTFYKCKSLQTINIPPGIERIEYGCFLFCSNLTNVTFPEGIIEIGDSAFSFCTSLASVTFPSSLKNIGNGAFEYCTALSHNSIHMKDGIEYINRAFSGCNFTNFRIPPLITDVNANILARNLGLVSIELSENVTVFRTATYSNDHTPQASLRNITFPTECEVDTTALNSYKDLLAAFPAGADHDTIIDAIKHRFDNLPIHKVCYYQSYNNTTSNQLNNATEVRISQRRSKVDPTGNQQDCLGMTPLHILACSTKPTIEMYQLLIDKYPETLIMKDKWEDIPLLYVFWCNASVEVLDLLVESYKSLHPEFEFDWSGMIQTMTKRNVPLANIQRLVNTHQSSFPNQECNLQTVVMELASLDANRIRRYDPHTPIETFQYLLWITIRKRLDSLAVRGWREELENSIASLPVLGRSRDRDTKAVFDRLSTYESIKEGTSVLELALWKAQNDESRGKRARMSEDNSYREQCRINSGADIIIRNVLPYIMPLPEMEIRDDSSDSSSSSL